MLDSDFQRLVEWLLYPCVPVLYGLAVLWCLREEEVVALEFVGFQADPGRHEAHPGYGVQVPGPR